jgi:hypothetical protein
LAKPKEEPEKPAAGKPGGRRFVKALWRVGKFAVPLAAAGILTYALWPERPHTKPQKGLAPQHEVAEGTELAEEGIDTPGGRVVFLRPAQGALCANCHDLKGLAAHEARELSRLGRQVEGLYPSEFRLTKERLVFNPASMGERVGGSYRTGKHEIELSLRHFADLSSREDVLRHELVHFFTTYPDHALREPWAYAAAFTHDPTAYRRPLDARNRTDLANKFTHAFLSRAAVLGGRVPKPLESERDTFQVEDAVRQYQEALREEDVRAAASLWREAYEEYNRNDLFWEVMTKSHVDPHLVHDVLLARRLFAARDPAFLRAHGDARVLQGAKALLEEHIRQSQADPVDIIQRINDPHHTFAAARERFHFHYKKKFPQLQRADVDGIYYALLHRAFCNPRNEVNYGLAPAQNLRETAEAKRTALAVAVSQLTTEARALERQGRADLAKAVRGRAESYGLRIADLERALRDKSYLRVHER